MINFFNTLKALLFTSSLSIADVIFISIIAVMGGWWYLALIPWFIFSTVVEATIE